jgi:uncharacterized protein (TIGR04255 family)
MSIVNFSNPPISEVVCGVEFNAPNFSTVHFGQYWQKISERYPQYFDQPPLGDFPIISGLPSLRRVWFESTDKNQIIQLQFDRFFYNWRREHIAEPYPRFKNIYYNFITEWNIFQQWWSTNTSNPVFPVRYELTYLNQLDNNFGWNSTEDNYKIFTFKGRKWDKFLPLPNVHVSNLQFLLPDNLGFLIVNTNQAIKAIDQAPITTFELTIKSIDSNIDVDEWFAKAHEYIVRGFLDLTRESIQKEWGLENE